MAKMILFPFADIFPQKPTHKLKWIFVCNSMLFYILSSLWSLCARFYSIIRRAHCFSAEFVVCCHQNEKTYHKLKIKSTSYNSKLPANSIKQTGKDGSSPLCFFSSFSVESFINICSVYLINFAIVIKHHKKPSNGHSV